MSKKVLSLSFVNNKQLYYKFKHYLNMKVFSVESVYINYIITNLIKRLGFYTLLYYDLIYLTNKNFLVKLICKVELPISIFRYFFYFINIKYFTKFSTNFSYYSNLKNIFNKFLFQKVKKQAIVTFKLLNFISLYNLSILGGQIFSFLKMGITFITNIYSKNYTIPTNTVKCEKIFLKKTFNRYLQSETNKIYFLSLQNFILTKQSNFSINNWYFLIRKFFIFFLEKRLLNKQIQFQTLTKNNFNTLFKNLFYSSYFLFKSSKISILTYNVFNQMRSLLGNDASKITISVERQFLRLVQKVSTLVTHRRFKLENYSFLKYKFIMFMQMLNLKIYLENFLYKSFQKDINIDLFFLNNNYYYTNNLKSYLNNTFIKFKYMNKNLYWWEDFMKNSYKYNINLLLFSLLTTNIDMYTNLVVSEYQKNFTNFRVRGRLWRFFLKSTRNFIKQHKHSLIKSITIIISGRLYKKMRSDRKIYIINSQNNRNKIPLTTFSSNIKYAYQTCFTKNGTIGFKVFFNLK